MPKISQIKVDLPKLKNRKRVAAYARVSRDSETLLHSLSAQVSYYSSLIQKNPEWEYVGVYVDEGITGTSTDKRDDFNRMIADCESGMIDLILTKAISRFARNTVDLLNTVRHLKDIGVEVRFERERISSTSGDGELLLTILASFAQEESESLSQNIKWAIKKGYEKGKSHCHPRALGYVWDGEQYQIVPEEAETVRTIFDLYEKGISTLQIPKIMNTMGRTGVNGNPLTRASVKDILLNEMYIGNLVLQKFYSPKIRKKSRNYGQLQRYRVEEAHEPIVDLETFVNVQKERKRRGENAANRNKEITCFSGKVVCGKCGYKCSRRNIVHSKKTKRVFNKRWVCNAFETKGMDFCDMQPVAEDDLREAATITMGNAFLDEEQFRRNVKTVVIYDDRIIFHMKDGRKLLWQRE